MPLKAQRSALASLTILERDPLGKYQRLAYGFMEVAQAHPT